MTQTQNSSRTAELTWLRQQAAEMAKISKVRIAKAFPWFNKLPVQRQDALCLVSANGIESFINWYEDSSRETWFVDDFFNTAPRDLVETISLQQTLQLIQVVVDTVEERVSGRSSELREATLRFSRLIAFAAAHRYADAAEERGLWDARLEALIVDSIITGSAESELASRVAALGWRGTGPTAVLVGSHNGEVEVSKIRKAAKKECFDVLIAVQGNRLVLVLGTVEKDPEGDYTEKFQQLANQLICFFNDQPVVLGKVVPEITQAHASARAAINSVAVSCASTNKVFPTHSDMLLAERVIAGDTQAKQTLINEVYKPLLQAPGELIVTLSSYLANGSSLEATSKDLFVHTNTVRYRLKRIHQLIGWQPTKPRDAYILQTALVLGKINTAEKKRNKTVSQR